MKIPDNLKWEFRGITLGEGGQGKVLEVEDKTEKDKRKYAMKVLSKNKPQKAFERFHREIHAIKNLDHPFIAKILDHSEIDDDFNYYVMELVEGARSLKKLMEIDENPYYGNVLKSLDLFTQIVEVIRECEAIGIVHRDLSPANILIVPDESIKVIDFGICQIEEATRITLTDEGVGTPYYLAPECEPGAEGEISSSSDLYSAGKILWSAITNLMALARESPVFNAKSMESIFPDHPQTWHLHHIFEKTIRHKPVDRWKDAKEALGDCTIIRLVIARGYPPLELTTEFCPVCGMGTLDFAEGRAVFANPLPSGISAMQCSDCGYCFAVNRGKGREKIETRKKLE